MNPSTLPSLLSSCRTVDGLHLLVDPSGPLAVLSFHAACAAEVQEARAALAALNELGLPAIAIAMDGAALLGRVHEVAATLPAPVISDPFGRMSLDGASRVWLVDGGELRVRMELGRASRRSLFAAAFDLAWRQAA